MSTEDQKEAAAPELPTVEAPQMVSVATFNPNQYEMPTVNDLANILSLMGIHFGPISGQDRSGNLVTADGRVAVPAPLRRFFTIREVPANASA